MKKFLGLLAILLVVPVAVFAVSASSTDTGHLGNSQWHVQSDGDIVPATDSSQDLGASGGEIDNIYVDSLWLGGTEYTSIALGSDGNWTNDGTTVVLDANPTEIVFTNATGHLLVEGLTVDTDDIILDNAQTIDGGTNNKIIFGDNSDTFTVEFTGDDTEFNSSDGGVIFDLDEADGTVDFRLSNDDDDYLQFSTSGGEPLINTVGACDLNITASSGEIVFGDENLTTTGTLDAGASTLSSAEINGTVTLANDEFIHNATDDTVLIGSNDEAAVLRVQGFEGKDAKVVIACDEGDNGVDIWELESDVTTNDLLIKNDSTTILTIIDSNSQITTTGDIVVEGTTPKVEIGDAGEEDSKLVFDGNVYDFYVGLDDSADGFCIGSGSTVGTAGAITIASTGTVTLSHDTILEGTTPTLTIGDGGAEDAALTYDGNAVDYYLGIDDTDDYLTLGSGSTVGSNEIATIASDGTVTIALDLTVSDDLTVTDDTTLTDALAVNGNVTFGDASSDTVTCTSRFIVRTVAATSTTACTTGEIVFCSGDNGFWGATSSTVGSFVSLGS
jgi:hypothetical protein